MRSRFSSGQRDKNEPEVVAALEAAGAVVRKLDPPMPDLLVSFRGMLTLIEVKRERADEGRGVHKGKHSDPDPRYRELTPMQVRWWRAWEAAGGKPPAIVHGPAEALAAIAGPQCGPTSASGVPCPLHGGTLTRDGCTGATPDASDART